MKIGTFGIGFTLGLGTGLILREVTPVLGEIAVPVAKVTLKMGIRIFERTREGMMRVGEMVEDLLAEVQLDLKGEKNGKSKVRVNKTRRKKREEEVAAELKEVA